MDFSQFNPKTPYPDGAAIRAKLQKEIDETPMTAAERTAASKDLIRLATAIFDEEIKPYREEERRLQEAFWLQCREDHRYGHYSQTIIDIIEYEAYSRGHSAGYPEMYNCLYDIVDFVRAIYKAKEAESPDGGD
jgi:hypothetical protein